jgi:alcohol dehydrogenase
MISLFSLPVKLVCGPGCIQQIGEEAQGLGRKALIVTYPDIRRLGILDTVVKSLESKGIAIKIYEDLEPNPRAPSIDRGAIVARQGKVDLVIGLGGGSAMDAAKCIALASSGQAPIWDYVMNKAAVTGPVPSLIQVPTLAGTGSEINPIAVITDWESHEKRILVHPALWAKAAIVDPAVTLSVPAKLTASGGLDTLAHILECYLMPQEPLPINDALREGVMKVVVRTLPRVLAHPEDMDARAQLSWASTFAGSGISRFGGTVGNMTCHGIEHGVGGYFDINHGAGLAALLPVWMKQFRPVRQQRFALLGANVFGQIDGIRGFEEWLECIGMKYRLRDLGCDLNRAEDIAATALKVWDFRFHPTPMEATTIAQIYREAF